MAARLGSVLYWAAPVGDLLFRKSGHQVHVHDLEIRRMFLRNHKAGSMAGINAQDTAVICSLALQHGVSLDLIRRALMRDARGRGSGSLACALDQIADQERGNG
jgi:hypothetical protein